MNEIGNKLVEIRKQKGLTQEELSEMANINLRTLQRVEVGDTSPRSNTLNGICNALEINIEDILDYGKKEDKNFLIVFHLSALSFLVMPLGNIIIPLILWLTKKDKIKSLNRQGAALLNYQILWTVLAFISFMVPLFAEILHLSLRRFITIELFLSLYTINFLYIIIVSILISKGHTKNYYPQIIRILKS